MISSLCLLLWYCDTVFAIVPDFVIYYISGLLIMKTASVRIAAVVSTCTSYLSVNPLIKRKYMSMCAWLTLFFINNTFAYYNYFCVFSYSRGYMEYTVGNMLYWKSQNLVSQFTVNVKTVINEARAFLKGHMLVVCENYIHVHN